MKFNFKNYQESKTKIYLKKSNFLMLTTGANKNSLNWRVFEQHLKKLKLKYYKTYNKIIKKALSNSIYKNFKNSVSSTFFLLHLKKLKSTASFKSSILNTLTYGLLLNVLLIKLNEKIYTVKQIKQMSSFCYEKNIAIIQQFLITITKIPKTLKTTHQ